MLSLSRLSGLRRVTNVVTSLASVRTLATKPALRTTAQLCFPRSVAAGSNPRSLSSQEKTTSLADQILHAKKEQESKDKGQSEGQGQEQEENKGGPKPLTKWQKLGYIFFVVSVIGGSISYIILFSLPDKDEKGQVIEDEFSSLPFPKQYFLRLKNHFFKTKKSLEEPFSEKLLPDPLPEPYIQPKYTVLIELTGLLVHSTWNHKHGWRFQKRPGVDMFLSEVGYPNFELVLYTVENAMTFYPIVQGLDPNGQFFMYHLFRDATRYVNGHHTKDLKALNRDLKRVIMIDWNKDAVAINPENSLILEKWNGDNADRKLVGLIQLLQAIRQTDVDDVREVLQYYRQFDDPIEAFRENQRKLQIELEADEKRKEEQQKKTSFLSKAGFSGFGRQRT